MYKTFSVFTLFALFAFLTAPAGLNAQEADSRATLLWAQRLAGRIDTSLNSVVRSQNPVDLIVKLNTAWEQFDAVAQAGLYCVEARVAAEKGRTESDPNSYSLGFDLNALLIRATEARQQAHQLRMAADACLIRSGQAEVETSAFTPADLLRYDAEIVEIDLGDALASEDFHILSQKLEHGRRILQHALVMTETLDNCFQTRDAAQRVREYCTQAQLSSNWEEVADILESAMEQLEVMKIASATCK